MPLLRWKNQNQLQARHQTSVFQWREILSCPSSIVFCGERTGKDEFFGHSEIYRSDVRLLPPEAVRVSTAPGIGCDEFPSGIPWPVALQQSWPPFPPGNDSLPPQAVVQGFLVSERPPDPWLSGGPQVPARGTGGSRHSRRCRETCQRWRAHLAGHRHEGLQFGLVACQ